MKTKVDAKFTGPEGDPQVVAVREHAMELCQTPLEKDARGKLTSLNIVKQQEYDVEGDASLTPRIDEYLSIINNGHEAAKEVLPDVHPALKADALHAGRGAAMDKYNAGENEDEGKAAAKAAAFSVVPLTPEEEGKLVAKIKAAFDFEEDATYKSLSSEQKKQVKSEMVKVLSVDVVSKSSGERSGAIDGLTFTDVQVKNALAEQINACPLTALQTGEIDKKVKDLVDKHADFEHSVVKAQTSLTHKAAATESAKKAVYDAIKAVNYCERDAKIADETTYADLVQTAVDEAIDAEVANNSFPMTDADKATIKAQVATAFNAETNKAKTDKVQEKKAIVLEKAETEAETEISKLAPKHRDAGAQKLLDAVQKALDKVLDAEIAEITADLPLDQATKDMIKAEVTKALDADILSTEVTLDDATKQTFLTELESEVEILVKSLEEKTEDKVKIEAVKAVNGKINKKVETEAVEALIAEAEMTDSKLFGEGDSVQTEKKKVKMAAEKAVQEYLSSPSLSAKRNVQIIVIKNLAGDSVAVFKTIPLSATLKAQLETEYTDLFKKVQDSDKISDAQAVKEDVVKAVTAAAVEKKISERAAEITAKMTEVGKQKIETAVAKATAAPSSETVLGSPDDANPDQVKLEQPSTSATGASEQVINKQLENFTRTLNEWGTAEKAVITQVTHVKKANQYRVLTKKAQEGVLKTKDSKKIKSIFEATKPMFNARLGQVRFVIQAAQSKKTTKVNPESFLQLQTPPGADKKSAEELQKKIQELGLVDIKGDEFVGSSFTQSLKELMEGMKGDIASDQDMHASSEKLLKLYSELVKFETAKGQELDDLYGRKWEEDFEDAGVEAVDSNTNGPNTGATDSSEGCSNGTKITVISILSVVGLAAIAGAAFFMCRSRAPTKGETSKTGAAFEDSESEEVTVE